MVFMFVFAQCLLHVFNGHLVLALFHFYTEHGKHQTQSFISGRYLFWCLYLFCFMFSGIRFDFVLFRFCSIRFDWIGFGSVLFCMHWLVSAIFNMHTNRKRLSLSVAFQSEFNEI